MVNSFGKRLKSIRNILGMGQAQFGETLGVTHGVTVSRWENDKQKPDLEILTELVNLYKINLNWLLTGFGEPFEFRGSEVAGGFIMNDSSLRIKYFSEIRASAGAGSFVDAELAEDYYVDKSVACGNGEFVAIRVAGNSMEPTLRDNDKILVDTSGENLKTLTPDKIYIVRTEGTVIVKRYSGRDGSVCRFKSDNSIYGGYNLDMKDEANKIIGVLKGILFRSI